MGQDKAGKISAEQLKKASECTSREELLELADQEGIELTDEQLEQVSGGWGNDRRCPQCGSDNIVYDNYLSIFICQDCLNEF